MSKVSFLDVSEIAMRKILEKCNYKSIQCLRKVCHDIRNFIDDIKPDSKFRKIVVISSSNSISMDLSSFEELEDIDDDENAVTIGYDKHADSGCMLTCDMEEPKFLENQSFFDVFWNDFRVLMNHQKTILGDFLFLIDLEDDSEIPMEKEAAKRMSEKLKEILGSKKIRAESFQMDILEKDSFLSTLQSMDSEVLRKIEILNVEDDVYTTLNSEDVGNLEQWRRSRILKTHKIRMVSLEDIFHFEKAEVEMRTLTSEPILMLKNKFLRLLETSSAPKSISIFHNLRASELIRVLGPPLNPESLDKRWKFEIPGVLEAVRVFNSLGKLNFCIGERDEDFEDDEDSDDLVGDSEDSEDDLY